MHLCEIIHTLSRIKLGSAIKLKFQSKGSSYLIIDMKSETSMSARRKTVSTPKSVKEDLNKNDNDNKEKESIKGYDNLDTKLQRTNNKFILLQTLVLKNKTLLLYLQRIH